MKRFISLRAILCLITITGGVKIILPIFEDETSHFSDNSMNVFNIVSPSLAAAPQKTPKTEAKEPIQCETPEAILLTIDHERDLLQTQTTMLAERKASVILADEKLRQETTRLSNLKKDLEGLLKRIEDAKSDDLKRLVSIYVNMKPKEAANIMNTLDIEVAVMVLGQMKERDAAPIFAKLNTVRSQAISKIILERSKLPGDQKLNGITLQ